MNTQDIDNMPAGREMDILIAERIFGYRYKPANNVTGWKVDGKAMELPCYSTDIAAAWQVAEKFDQGIALFRNLWANGKWYWHCHIGGSINGPGESWAEELTAPLAICRAALKFRGAIDVH